ncbi:hypothetical protein [Rhizobium sp. NXC14]|uniref:hypothetical protein n=1 Tax=Rhizobium sp. NXC14 TaxID=1981173 RepID=UPI0012F47FEC|nr:hypothetical protein [Rhizobium sp. NXC14]
MISRNRRSRNEWNINDKDYNAKAFNKVLTINFEGGILQSAYRPEKRRMLHETEGMTAELRPAAIRSLLLAGH